jgi:hypothetical protein
VLSGGSAFLRLSQRRAQRREQTKNSAYNLSFRRSAPTALWENEAIFPEKSTSKSILDATPDPKTLPRAELAAKIYAHLYNVNNLMKQPTDD